MEPNNKESSPHSLITHVNINIQQLPACPRCAKEGIESVLLPFGDYTREHEVIYLKGWACANCGHNLFMDAGQLAKVAVITKGPRP